MTLKEKMYFDCTLNTHEQAEKNEKIADEFAIDFAQWVQFHSELWIKYRTSELLELFKKENQL